LIHPTRKLLDQPALYEFATPVGGTYPPWTEPYYWFEGMQIRFSLVRQLLLIARALWLYWFALMPFFLGGIIFTALAVEPFWKAGGIFSHWPVIVPALAGLGMHALLHVEYRYVASFLVIVWTCTFAGTRFASDPVVAKVVRSILVGTALVLLVQLAADTAENIAFAPQTAQSSSVRRTAASLERAGVKRGTQVATIASLNQTYWARMLGLRIIAEVPYDQRTAFWFGGDEVQHRVFSVLKKAGAGIVVAENVPSVADTSKWQQLDGTEAWWIDLTLW